MIFPRFCLSAETCEVGIVFGFLGTDTHIVCVA